jgi:6-phosphogluconate dehydrogenase
MANEAVADIGLIGLAVMGENLALNIADHGFKVAVYNRTTQVMRDFIARNPNTPGGLVSCETTEQLVKAIKRPRKFIILVKAGPAIDALAEPAACLMCSETLWWRCHRRLIAELSAEAKR